MRTYEPDDAPAVVAAVTASIEHLRPWMPWVAHEPQTAAQRRELFATWARVREETGDTAYGIFRGTEVVGGSGLHVRSGPAVREIGYWVRADAVRQAIASRVTAVLTTAAFALPEVQAVEICHDRRNAASGRVPARLGYRLVEEARRPPAAPGESGLVWRWRVARREWHDRLG